MGNCVSTSSSNTQFMQTAKIIFFDGGLKEFSKPIKAEEIIVQNPGYFLCHWDSLHIGKFMAAVNSKEDLELGELYFVLPLSKLQYVLSASDMAAMVFKANSAIKQIIGNGSTDNIYTERSEMMSCVSGGLDEMLFSGNASRTKLETIQEGT
ncbi:hypothetical protein KI387_023382, partial [Taxus chinensis]